LVRDPIEWNVLEECVAVMMRIEKWDLDKRDKALGRSLIIFVIYSRLPFVCLYSGEGKAETWDSPATEKLQHDQRASLYKYILLQADREMFRHELYKRIECPGSREY